MSSAAILRGTGQWKASSNEEATFEGYGPRSGMLIPGRDHNRNRVVGEFRHLMSKNGGNLAEAGAVGSGCSAAKARFPFRKKRQAKTKMLDIAGSGAEI